MNKTDAINLLGGTASAAASAIGITPQAFGQWPCDLPRRLEDRVVAAIARRTLPASAFQAPELAEKDPDREEARA